MQVILIIFGFMHRETVVGILNGQNEAGWEGTHFLAFVKDLYRLDGSVEQMCGMTMGNKRSKRCTRYPISRDRRGGARDEWN